MTLGRNFMRALRLEVPILRLGDNKGNKSMTYDYTYEYEELECQLDLGFQPLGIFSLPAGMLLLVDSPQSRELCELLIQGKLPEDYPNDARFFQVAIDGGTTDEIIEALPKVGPVRDFNLLVLDPSVERFRCLRESCGGELRVLVELQGFLNDYCLMPDFSLTQSPTLGALLLSSAASFLLENRNSVGAIERLRKAIELVETPSPFFAAGLKADLAQLLLGDSATRLEGITALRSALACLVSSDLHEFTAEVHLSLAIALQEASTEDALSLKEAIGHYLDAARLVTAKSSPMIYGTAHMNLALAYLTKQMVDASDQLRYGIAVSSLRQAQSAFDRETYPEAWAVVRMNLANSLVYAPSSHQGDNLVEALEIYEELLQVRNRDDDPIGYARVCANQGNVLAHLGMFDYAKAKLHEGRSIFEEFNMLPETSGVREVLDHIERERVGRASSR